MFIDGRALPPDEVLDADLCVIGGGAAGLSLIQGLVGRGLRIVLLESGGQTDTRSLDHLNSGLSNQPDYPFQATRARGFGGTTARWTGACIPLDPVDFSARSWLAHSGWPISADDLAPFYDAARAIYGLPPAQGEAISGGPFGSGAAHQKTVWFSNPLNLADRFRSLVAQDTNIRCVLHATVTELATHQNGQSVHRARLAFENGKSAEVTAKAFVLATGGIENARLLLNSRDRQPAGLGNAYDTVGRYHMEHPIRAVGTLSLDVNKNAALPFTNRRPTGGTTSEQTFGLSAAVRSREQLLDLHIRLFRYSPAEAHPAVVAGKALAASPSLPQLGQYVRHHAQHLPVVILPYVGWHLRNKVWKAAHFDHVRLTAFAEQEPDPANRITLSSERDAYGLQLPHLHLRESALMSDSIARSMAILEQDLAKRGIGRLSHDPQRLAHLAHYSKYGLHQMGATRMSDDPRFGVVDRHLCVHNVNNLFISGSSVFTTGGAANPTFTISALSLRLAAHLLRIIGKVA